jgi:nicotinate-nucleotide adenylyltransferase
VAQDALIRLGLARVVFIPAFEPPHKRGRPVSPAPLRLAMLRAAVADDDRFAVDDIEIRRGGTSYTVDTLRALHATDPAAELVLLLGTDQYEEIETWREPAELRTLARIAVLSREGRHPVLRADGATRVPVTRIDVSATEIRRRVAAGEPIRYLVPAAVEAFIRQHRLYQPAAG